MSWAETRGDGDGPCPLRLLHCQGTDEVGYAQRVPAGAQQSVQCVAEEGKPSPPSLPVRLEGKFLPWIQ